MKNIILTLLIGLVAGIIDTMPMIKMKLDKYSVTSAFVFYFIMPIIVFNLYLGVIPWWMKGSLVTLILALPIIIIVGKNDKKSTLPMIINSIVLGTLIGVAGQLLNLSSTP